MPVSSIMIGLCAAGYSIAVLRLGIYFSHWDCVEDQQRECVACFVCACGLILYSPLPSHEGVQGCVYQILGLGYMGRLDTDSDVCCIMILVTGWHTVSRLQPMNRLLHCDSSWKEADSSQLICYDSDNLLRDVWTPPLYTNCQCQCRIKFDWPVSV